MSEVESFSIPLLTAAFRPSSTSRGVLAAMINFFKSYSSESELNSAITKLMGLDTQPRVTLAKSQWLFSEGMMCRMLKSIRCDFWTRMGIHARVPAADCWR